MLATMTTRMGESNCFVTNNEYHANVDVVTRMAWMMVVEETTVVESKSDSVR